MGSSVAALSWLCSWVCGQPAGCLGAGCLGWPWLCSADLSPSRRLNQGCLPGEMRSRRVKGSISGLWRHGIELAGLPYHCILLAEANQKGKPDSRGQEELQNAM